MAGESPVKPTWVNILIGAVCIVVANLSLAAINAAVALPGPFWVWSALAACIAVLVWFAIAARLKR